MRKLLLATAFCLGLLSYGETPARAESVFVSDEVVVVVTPPPPQVEVITVAPGPNYVWSRGYWYWTGGRYVWVRGRYIARVPGRVWVHSHYVRHSRGWVRVRGHWC